MNTCVFCVVMLCRFSSCLNSEKVCIDIVTQMLSECQSTVAHNLRNVLPYIQNAYTSIDLLLCNMTATKNAMVNQTGESVK